MRNDRSTWIIVANRACAKVFTCPPGQRRRPALIKTIDHPEGRLDTHHFNADKSGRTFPRFGGGSSALEKAHDAVEREADRFAHSLAELLDQARARDELGDLIVIAEPRFLGRLRKVMPRCVSREVDKDVAGLPAAELLAVVERVVEETRRPS